MKNNNPITVIWSKLKLEVEFRYGWCLFFLTGSSSFSQPSIEICRQIFVCW